jgi:hypothetical protein
VSQNIFNSPAKVESIGLVGAVRFLSEKSGSYELGDYYSPSFTGGLFLSKIPERKRRYSEFLGLTSTSDRRAYGG